MWDFRSIAYHHFIRSYRRDGCWFCSGEFLFTHPVLRVAISFLQEFDTPRNLYQREGLFRGMCEKSNITLKDIEMAKFETDNNCAVKK